MVVLAQQVDNLLEDNGGGEPRGDQREPLIPDRGQWASEVLDLEPLYPHLAELRNPRVFNAATPACYAAACPGTLIWCGIQLFLVPPVWHDPGDRVREGGGEGGG